MTFNDIFASMIVFFFWFMAIWIFIAVFADIFRRNDIHGLAKAGWIVLIFVVPFIGALIYIIARPRTLAATRWKDPSTWQPPSGRELTRYSVTVPGRKSAASISRRRTIPGSDQS